MNIQLIAIGTKMPHWVTTACDDFLNRLPKDYVITLTEIPAIKRQKNADTSAILKKEGDKIRQAIKPGHRLICLDRLGMPIDTKTLKNHLQKAHDHSDPFTLVIGGPEGICETLIKAAQQVWSLSSLTLPHPLVRVLVAEQCYRAWSMIVGHPYHR